MIERGDWQNAEDKEYCETCAFEWHPRNCVKHGRPYFLICQYILVNEKPRPCKFGVGCFCKTPKGTTEDEIIHQGIE